MTQSNKIKWFNSIQTKLTLIVLIVITILFISFAGYLFITTAQKKEQELVNVSNTTASRLLQHLTLPLWVFDEPQIEDSIESEMMGDPRIAGIIVRDEDGETIIEGKRRDDSWTNVVDANRAFSNNELIKATTEVKQDDKIIGFIEVYVTQRFLQQELINTILNEAIKLIILAVALIVAITITVRAMLLKSITRLTSAADEISRGKLDEPLAISEASNEIGQLTEAFERMRISLQIAMQNMNQPKKAS